MADKNYRIRIFNISSTDGRDELEKLIDKCYDPESGYSLLSKQIKKTKYQGEDGSFDEWQAIVEYVINKIDLDSI